MSLYFSRSEIECVHIFMSVDILIFTLMNKYPQHLFRSAFNYVQCGIEILITHYYCTQNYINMHPHSIVNYHADSCLDHCRNIKLWHKVRQ